MYGWRIPMRQRRSSGAAASGHARAGTSQRRNAGDGRVNCREAHLGAGRTRRFLFPRLVAFIWQKHHLPSMEEWCRHHAARHSAYLRAAAGAVVDSLFGFMGYLRYSRVKVTRVCITGYSFRLCTVDSCRLSCSRFYWQCWKNFKISQQTAPPR